ncbi:hypothetical protein PGT21_031280 [Puccinia graminis f. sp. tritici]|uniref:Secreted protein n=1 Tax=Puccinia graminis f. sp. tritici TaxID=56615 RepID=A0A5B0QKE3_PUCGR|nr:hypothetical protein PGT21_031280 [Puccinia graminis f. sp. tritici]KAA1130742.1 hypothetical protein PGTUg99_011086 [Puccinia graminis f. sp. tritici]
MVPRTILITVLMACIPAATASGVECANSDCGNTAQPIYYHNWPPEAMCGEDLGNGVCDKIRPKSYYKCEKCKSITFKNQPNQADTTPICKHKAKRILTLPLVQMPVVAASSSGAASQPPSSEGGTPFEVVGNNVKCYKFF